MNGYLNTQQKSECSGCSACKQVCPVNAISMVNDSEGFCYPTVNKSLCISCNKCHKVCQYESIPAKQTETKTVFGGSIKDSEILSESTSGGAFSAIADSWCDEDYIIFGATSDGLKVYHTYIDNKKYLYKFRQSKYSQSDMGNSYIQAEDFLKKGKKVLFSGTPCQIAGLIKFLPFDLLSNLLTVEVICEGVPSPLYINKYNDFLKEKYHSDISSLEYRHKDLHKIRNLTYGKWDFQIMKTVLKNGKEIKTDRWFNPFWSCWLQHFMSRPSCYSCMYTTPERVADISLGDLWGVHLYCPELYNNNAGASLIICNSKKGKIVLDKAKQLLSGHELCFENALKYQGPMRKSIAMNPDRNKFMNDLRTCSYKQICRKWAIRPTIKLLFQKYIWGNRQKVCLFNVKTELKSFYNKIK